MQHDLGIYLISSHFVTYSWKMLEIISSYVGSLLIDQEIIRSLSVQTTKIKNTKLLQSSYELDSTEYKITVQNNWDTINFQFNTS